mmetsp:Transcript_36064/g.84556  ORF Transcript_36064/g.84556 Transcript_36064/m.84556 type:complete len:303 (+) Transcript_36064:103-1011(+)
MERSNTTPLTTKCLIGGSYAGLIAVNVLAGSKLFGLRTNSELSGAYPTHVTPAGFTFSIWGPIFMLQMGGTISISCGAVPSTSVTAVTLPWVLTWLFECLWQFVFFTAPVPPSAASDSRRLLTLGPAAVMLVSAYASMLTAGIRLRLKDVAENSSACSQLLSACFVDLPTGMNAGWLAAASGIGITLVSQIALPSVATPQGGAVLVSGLSGLAAIASIALGSSLRSVAVGIGYAAATAWACFGITRATDVPSAVATAAHRGIYIAGAGGVVAVVSAAVAHCCCGDEHKALLRPLLSGPRSST